MKKLFLLFLSVSFSSLASIDLSIGSSYRGVAVFDQNSLQKLSPLGLALGSSNGVPTDSGFRPWQLEVTWNAEVSSEKGYFVVTDLRVADYRQPQFNSPNSQTGIDWIVDSQFRIDLGLFGVQLGPRWRRVSLNAGEFLSSSQMGLALGFLHKNSFLEFLIEGALMAIGQNPAAMGIQRDGSSLRVRLTKSFFIQEQSFSGALEFYHHHRSFYASSLASSAYFIDDAQIGFLLGTSF